MNNMKRIKNVNTTILAIVNDLESSRPSEPLILVLLKVREDDVVGKLVNLNAVDGCNVNRSGFIDCFDDDGSTDDGFLDGPATEGLLAGLEEDLSVDIVGIFFGSYMYYE